MPEEHVAKKGGIYGSLLDKKAYFIIIF